MRDMFQDAGFKRLLCSPGWQKSKGFFFEAGASYSRVFCCNAGSHLKVGLDPLARVSGWSAAAAGSESAAEYHWAVPENDEACSLCPLGQYSDSLNFNKNCTSAARDQFVPAPGMNTATNCSKNSYTNPPNSTLCELCPAGKKMIRGTTETTCAECGVGQFQDISGIETCNDCPIGYYQNEIGIPYCVGCIPGQFQDREGNASCVKCASGRQFNASIVVGISASNCVACDKGQHQEEEGSTFCLPCLTGTFQNVPGSSSCNDCPIGFSNGETEKESCTSCPKGTFQDANGEAN